MTQGPSAEIRARLLARRRALGAARTARLSREVTERFWASSGISAELWRDKRVALYRSLPTELDLRTLEGRLASCGARLCFPRILNQRLHQMEFAAAPPVGPAEGADPSFSENRAWPPGAHGVEEPPLHFRAVDSSEIDVIFVPGVAFGEQGERIGMGAGYYDRYLPSAPRALKVALAFDFQLLPKLDQGPWDQRVDWIWTEHRQIRLRPWP